MPRTILLILGGVCFGLGAFCVRTGQLTAGGLLACLLATQV